MLFWAPRVTRGSGSHSLLSSYKQSSAWMWGGPADGWCEAGLCPVLTGEMTTASPVTLQTLGLFRRFSGQIDLRTRHLALF